MGRGGTKHNTEGFAIRQKPKKGLTLKETKKELEEFKKTGKHPVLSSKLQHVLPTLPVRDPNRPHVFIAFSSGKSDLGRILVEVFEPELPLTCRTFLTRCNPGAANSFKGTKVSRVVENYALHAGLSPGFKGSQQRRNEYLRHTQSGLVSLTVTGDALAVTFERALTLDDTHQVVGRVHGEDSMKVLQRLNTTAVQANDEPVNAIKISDCGQTDSQGNYDPLLAGSHRKESAQEVATRLQQDEEAARDAVGAALQAGMAQKRAAGTEPEKNGVQKKKKLAFESDLEDDSSSVSSDSNAS